MIGGHHEKKENKTTKAKSMTEGRDSAHTQDRLTQDRLKESKKTGKCPLCKKEIVHDFRPFCSKRCKMVDLYKWVSGHYVIPGDPTQVLDVEEKEAKEEWQSSSVDDDF